MLYFVLHEITAAGVMWFCWVQCIMTDSRVAAVAQQTGLTESRAADLLRGQWYMFLTDILMCVSQTGSPHHTVCIYIVTVCSQCIQCIHIVTMYSQCIQCIYIVTVYLQCIQCIYIVSHVYIVTRDVNGFPGPEFTARSLDCLGERDRWLTGGPQVGHTGPGYLSTRILTSLIVTVCSHCIQCIHIVTVYSQCIQCIYIVTVYSHCIIVPCFCCCFWKFVFVFAYS